MKEMSSRSDEAVLNWKNTKEIELSVSGFLDVKFLFL